MTIEYFKLPFSYSKHIINDKQKLNEEIVSQFSDYLQLSFEVIFTLSCKQTNKPNSTNYGTPEHL